MSLALHYDFVNNPSLTNQEVGPNLTCTRASLACMVDTDGYIRQVQNNEARFPAATFNHNLAFYSNVFSNAVWSKTSITPVQDVVGPFGGANTGWTIATSSTSARVEDSYTVKTSADYTFSVYAKAGITDWVNLAAVSFTTPGNVDTWFDLTNGVTGTVGAGITAAIESVGDGWYRCSISFTTDPVDTTGTLRINIVKANAQTVCDAGDSLLIYGAQLEEVSGRASALPTTYIDTTSVPVTSLSGTADGFLVEEARTNLVFQSEDLSTTWFPTFTVVTANNAVSPDGATTADRLTTDTVGGASGNCYIRSNGMTVVASSEYVISFFAKYTDTRWMDIRSVNYPNIFGCWFDIQNGVVGTESGTGINSTGMEDYGNGWYRCWVQFTSDATDTSMYFGLGAANADGDHSLTRDGSNSLLLWGMQTEAGAFRSSYIPTTTASVTRALDQVSGTLTTEMNIGEGTMVFTGIPNNVSAGHYLYRIDDATNSNRIYSFFNSTTANVRYAASVDGGNSLVINSTAYGTSVGTSFRTVIGYAEDDCAHFIDGVANGTDATYGPSSVNFTRFTPGLNGTVTSFNGVIQEFRGYNTRHTDAELEGMSNGIFPTFGSSYGRFPLGQFRQQSVS